MKKKIISVLLAMVTVVSLVSCGDSSNNKDEETSSLQVSTTENEIDKDEENTIEKEDDSEKSQDKVEDNEEKSSSSNLGESNDLDTLDKKAEYKQKLDDIQSGLSDLESYKSGSTGDMKYAANEEYLRWDDALNGIYDVLRNNLDPSEMDKLQQEEEAWIEAKEEEASKAAKEFEDGTAEALAYATSLAESTKNRCYELVDRYMK